MVPFFLRMLLKRGTGIRKGVTSTRNDKMKKWEQNTEEVMKSYEGKDMVKVMFCFYFSRSPIPVFVTSLFLSVEYLKY